MKTHNSMHSVCARLLRICALALIFALVSAARADYKSTILSDQPVGYWPLDLTVDTSGSAADLSGNGNAGTYVFISPSANRTAGPSAYIPNAAGFDGTSGYVSLPNVDALNIGGPITMEVWVQPNASQNDPADILARGYSTGDWNETYIGLTGGHFLAGREWGNNINGGAFGTAWTHAVCTFDGATCNFYINGLLVGTRADSGVSRTDVPWAIGNSTGGGAGRYFKGNICQVALYTHALTAQQVLAHYYLGTYGTTNVKPSINTQPISHNFYANGPATLSVAAVGPQPLGYQWFKGTTLLAGQTTALLSIASAQPSDAGQYKVIITNNFGSVTSSVATLTLAVQPVNYENLVLADLPVGYWPLDLGVDMSNSAIDLSGNGNAGTYMNISSSANQTTGPSPYIPNAAGFDGTSGYVSLPNVDALNIGGPITMEVWVQPDASQRDPADILARGYSTSDWNETYIGLTGGHFLAGREWGNNINGGAFGTAWTHAVCTFDGATCNFYINGLLVGSRTDSGVSRTDVPWAIGNSTGGGAGRYFKGNICQAALYTHALTSMQVAAHYYMGAFGTTNVAPGISTQPVSHNFYASQPTTLSVAAAGQEPLGYQWFKGTTPLAGKTTALLSIPSAQASDAGQYTVIVTNNFGSVTSSVATLTLAVQPVNYENLVLADLPVGYWPLDLGVDMSNSAIDISGNGNAGTYVNISSSANLTAGPSPYIPNAAGFDGTSGYVSLPNVDALNIGGPITMEVWVQPDASQRDPADILARGYSTSDWNETYIGLTGGHFLAGREWGNNINGGAFGTTWSHAVCTFDGAICNFYINGLLVGSRTDSGVSRTDVPWAIGNSTGGGAGRYFKGKICQAALYAHALTPEQVLAHYSLGINGTTDVAPTITSQPMSQRVTTNSLANFTVKVSALPAPTYQWYLVAGGSTNAIANANSATYTTPPVQDSDSGNGYFVVVSNPAGNVASKIATLTAGHTATMTSYLQCDQYFANYSSDIQAFSTFYPMASSLPAPDKVEYLHSFNSNGDLPNSSVERIHGWFTPPTSGNYVFFLSCDDSSVLWLSTNSDPANVYEIAQNEAWMWNSAGPDWTCSNTGSAEYAYFDTGEWRSDLFELKGGLNAYAYLSTMWSQWPGLNSDGSIPLVAGQKYYIELDHYQGSGGQSAAVTYKLAGNPDPNVGSVTLLSDGAISASVPDTMLPKPQPLITDIHSSGADRIVSGSNGLVNAVYNVLTTTNVSAALIDWTILSTHRFNASGKFSFTNTVPDGAQQRFYLLQVPN